MKSVSLKSEKKAKSLHLQNANCTQLARNSRFFSHSPPPSPPGITTSSWMDRREIETRQYIDRRERLGRVNPHVKIRSAACGSNYAWRNSHEHRQQWYSIEGSLIFHKTLVALAAFFLCYRTYFPML